MIIAVCLTLLTIIPQVLTDIDNCSVYGMKDSNGRETCFNCKIGYYTIDNNRRCGECASHCRTCSGEQTRCTTCHDGHILRLSSCEKCVDNCFQCRDLKTCHMCNSGYFINTESKCDACKSGCSICRTADTCTECNKGYVLATKEDVPICVRDGIGPALMAVMGLASGFVCLLFLVGWYRSSQVRHNKQSEEIIQGMVNNVSVDGQKTGEGAGNENGEYELNDFGVSRIEHRMEDNTLDESQFNAQALGDIEDTNNEQPTL